MVPGVGGQQFVQLQGMAPGQVVLTRPGAPTLPQQPQQYVQIIQTPSGPQLIQMPVQQIQQQPQQVIPIQTNVSGGKPVGQQQQQRGGGTKQILPKPSSGSNSSTTTAISQPQPAQQFIRPVQPQQTQGTQLIIGQNSQGASLIQGPNGTLLLNPAALQGHLAGQPLLFQTSGTGGGGGGGPVQLTLRTQGPVVGQSQSQNVVASSSNNTPLINALTSSASSASRTIVSPSQPRVGQPNMIFSPRPSIQAPQPQFLQIQTPNGPMLVAIQQQNPGIAQNPIQPIMIPNSMGQQVIFSQPQQQIQFLDQQSQGINNGNISGQIQSEDEKSNVKGKGKKGKAVQSPKRKVTTKKGKQQQLDQEESKGVNLADLLKESGILESSPPTSPTKTPDTLASQTDASSSVIINQGIQQLMQQQNQTNQTAMYVMPGQGTGSLPGGNILLAGGQQLPPQLRLALTPDGSVVIQQNVLPSNNSDNNSFVASASDSSKKMMDSVKDSSQPSPDSTTPTLDASPASTTSSSVKTALAEHLNNKANASALSPKSTSKKEGGKKTMKKSPKKESKEPIAVPQSIANNILGTPSSTCNTTSTSSPTAVIRIGNCDNLVQASTLPVLLTSPSVEQDSIKQESKLPVVQISLDDHQFADRLESQIKTLTDIQAPTSQQQGLLTELQTLHRTMQEARSKSVGNNAPVVSTASTTPVEGTKVLIAVPPQNQQQTIQPPQQIIIQTNAQQPQQLVNILNTNASTTQGNQTIRLISTPVSTTTGGAVSDGTSVSNPSTTTLFQVGNQQYITIATPASGVKNASLQVRHWYIELDNY